MTNNQAKADAYFHEGCFFSLLCCRKLEVCIIHENVLYTINYAIFTFHKILFKSH